MTMAPSFPCGAAEKEKKVVLTTGYGAYTVAPLKATGEALTSAAALLLGTETAPGSTAVATRHTDPGSPRRANLTLPGLLAGGTSRWFPSGMVPMLCDLFQVLMADLEGRHGWGAPEGEKSPG